MALGLLGRVRWGAAKPGSSALLSDGCQIAAELDGSFRQTRRPRAPASALLPLPRRLPAGTTLPTAGRPENSYPTLVSCRMVLELWVSSPPERPSRVSGGGLLIHSGGCPRTSASPRRCRSRWRSGDGAARSAGDRTPRQRRLPRPASRRNARAIVTRMGRVSSWDATELG